MAKYTVTRACGHEERIDLIGKVKIREWRLENVEPNKLCYECWQAEQDRKREEENRQATEAAKEQELPELVGTEKQVAWAETLRQKLMVDIEKIIDAIPEDKKDSPEAVLLMKAVDSIMAKTSASWFIENRFTRALYIVDQEMKLMQKLEKASAEVASETDAVQAKIEATVRPEKPKSETVAEIRVIGEAVEIDFPELREDFREIVKKQLCMEWTGKYWRRELKPGNGTVTDRAAEAGHRLLAAGFPIRIYDAELRGMAISSEYEMECTRWVKARKAGEYAGWFAISWGRDEDFYNVAKRLKRSRWSKPSVVVPPEQFEQVLDFAQMYDFTVSNAARQLAEAARQAKENTLVAKVDAPKTKSPIKADGTPPVLDVPAEVSIDDELKD